MSMIKSYVTSLRTAHSYTPRHSTSVPRIPSYLAAYQAANGR